MTLRYLEQAPNIEEIEGEKGMENRRENTSNVSLTGWIRDWLDKPSVISKVGNLAAYLRNSEKIPSYTGKMEKNSMNRDILKANK